MSEFRLGVSSTDWRASFAQWCVRHWCLLLAVVSATGYGALGTVWLRAGLFHYNNTLFDADTARVIVDMTRWRGPHGRTSVHPLFPGVMLPLATALSRAVPRRVACLLLVVLAAGIAIYCAGKLLRSFLGDAKAFSFSLLYASSASCIFMFSIVDTFVFSAMAIAWMLVVVRLRPKSWWGSAAAVLALGMLTTNVLHVGSARFFAAAGAWRERIWRAALLTLQTLAMTAGLALLQARLIPATKLFFSQRALRKEHHYLFHWTSWEEGWQRVTQVAVGMLQHSFVAPRPRFLATSTSPLVHTTFRGEAGSLRPYAAQALPVVFALAILLGWSCWINARTRSFRPACLGVLGVLTAHAVLMFLYGSEPLLYSPLWTLYAVLWIALAVAAAVQCGMPHPSARQLGLLAIGVLITNAVSVWRIVSTVSSRVS